MQELDPVTTISQCQLDILSDHGFPAEREDACEPNDPLCRPQSDANPEIGVVIAFHYLDVAITARSTGQ
jgi:hypothetical protein